MKGLETFFVGINLQRFCFLPRTVEQNYNDGIDIKVKPFQKPF